MILQYELPKLADEAYAAIGKVIGGIAIAKGGLHVLRDLTEAQSTMGALQRTIIDRVLGLLTRSGRPRVNENKRKRGEEIGEQPSDQAHDQAKRPDRVKKPTEKAKEYEL